jgi:hypothetical protein
MTSPSMIDIIKNESNSSSENESEEKNNSNGDDFDTPKKPRRPSLLSEPEFQENFMLDVLLTIRTCVRL